MIWMIWILPICPLDLPEMLVRRERRHRGQEVVHVVLRPEHVRHAQVNLLRLFLPGHEEGLFALHVEEELQHRPPPILEGLAELLNAA